MEREGEGRREEKRRGRRGGEKKRRGRGIIVGGMVLGLLLGCNNGLAEQLEKRNTFFDSVIKIGYEFQEIFGNFGNAMGEALGFNAVKSGDPKSKVGDHFDKIGKGLKSTKEQLDGLMKDLTSVPHADTKVVEAIISNAGEVIGKLITSVTNLAGVTQDGADIGDNVATAPKAALVDDVKIVIAGVKDIIETATGSGVKIDTGKAGGPVTNDGSKAPAAVIGKGNNKADAKAGPALAEEVSKADPWAMIDKIKNAKTGTVLVAANNYDAGELATAIAGGGVNDAGAKSIADLAAAVALKAMTKNSKFTADTTAAEAGAVKGAAVSAVNKVLGVLDEIIRRTVNIELGKVKDAVKGIQYSDKTTGTNATEASTSTK